MAGKERRAPRVGDRVRWREYGAVWNGRRGRSGKLARVVAVEPLPGGRVLVEVAPDTDTVCVVGGGERWPTELRRDE